MTERRQGASRSPTHLLHQAEQAAKRLFAAHALGLIQPRQLAILVAVSENDGLNQTDVVERTGIDRSAGLLQRRRSRERARAKVLHLTDEVRNANWQYGLP
jgi:DNA-binding MarR family transcriptional regulator